MKTSRIIQSVTDEKILLLPQFVGNINHHQVANEMANYLCKVGRNIKALIEERFEGGTYEKYLPLPSDAS